MLNKTLFALTLSLLLLLVAACGKDDPAGPAPEPIAYDLTLKMSSIDVTRSCDPDGPGEFLWRLILRKEDEFGNMITIHDTGEHLEVIDAGTRLGIQMDPVPFRLPNDPNAHFEVQYWVWENDGPSNSFMDIGAHDHRRDRSSDQLWAASRAYESDRYYENADGSGNGLLKFSLWTDYATCSGSAYYYVTWTPVMP